MRLNTSILKPSSKYGIEITTKIGCPVNCLKYCPQEVLLRKYGTDKRFLDLPDFYKILSKIPTYVEIVFSGFCEPFANSKCLDMINFAFKRGYTVSLFTTLYGATETDVNQLLNFRFKTFCLHLPDGKVMAVPSNPEYQSNVLAVLRNVKNVKTMSMTRQFKSNNRENVAREITVNQRKFEFCYLISNPAPVLLPNGDVYLCCNDFGLNHKVGNLLAPDCNYASVVERIKDSKGRFKLCTFCSSNTSVIDHYYHSARSMLNGLSKGSR